MRGRSIALFSILTLVAGLLGLTAAYAGGSPTTRVVDDDGMAVLGNCDSATATFSTIQAAVDAANTADTIKVCPGLYEEAVDVGKTLEILGAQSGIDGRTRPGTLAGESVVSPLNEPGAGFYVNAPSVVINGFTLQLWEGSAIDSTQSPPFVAAGLRVLNNIFRQNGTGLLIGSDNSLARRNLFEDNFFGIHMVTGTKATFTTNEFLGNEIGILLQGQILCQGYCTGGAQGFPTDVTISTNEIVGPEQAPAGSGEPTGIEANNTTGLRIIGNTISEVGAGIWLVGGNDATTIETNTVTDTGRAVLLGLGIFENAITYINANPNSNVTVKSNGLTNGGIGVLLEEFSLEGSMVVSRNTISGNEFGMSNFSSTQVNAAENWWGHASGPSEWSNGTGDGVGVEIRFFPWATNATFTAFAKCKNTPTAANQTINGTTGNDILCGGGGQDTIDGKAGNDLILGDAGSDILMGALGDDAILGGQGDDTLNGNAGFDHLQGQANTDTCIVGVDGGLTATCEGP